MLFLIGIFVLFLCTAFLASCETALTVVSKAKIHKLIKEGNKKALLVKELQDNAGQIISTLLTSSTLIDTLIPSMTAIWAVKTFDEFGQAVIAISTSVIILTYGEAVPKMIALRNPELILLKAAPFLKFITRIFKFLNIFMHFMANLTLKILRIKSSSQIELNEELKSYIDMHQQLSEEKSMLNSVLDLSKVQLKDIMMYRTNVKMINAEESFENVISLVKKSTFTRMPVWKDYPDNIVGVVHAKAFLEFFIHEDFSGKDFDLLRLCNKPWFVPETTDLLEQLKAFKIKQEHFAIVVDEYGMFQGIVTLEDLLEEIVGDINDEYDVTSDDFKIRPDGSVLLPGNFTVRDLNRQFHLNMIETEATLGGLLLHTAQKIPEVGRVYEIQNVQMEVMKRQKNYISLVKVYIKE